MSCFEKTRYVQAFFRPYLQFCDVLRIKPHVTKNSKKLNSGKTMYFANHRSWADFFVDGLAHEQFIIARTLCGGASYVARYMVCVGVPGMAFTAWIHNYIWLFRRRKNINRQWFTGFFRECWDLR